MIQQLEDATRNTLKKLRKQSVVMPSDYIKSFNIEIENITMETPIDLDLNLLIKEEIEFDLEKSFDLLKDTRTFLKEATNIINYSASAISERNEDSLLLAKTEIEDLVKRINKMSLDLYTDELTTTLNRKWFFREFLREEKYPASKGIIAFIDLNKLKEINDTFGHKIGDKAIVFFSNFIKQNFQENSFVRFAGDEFIILLDNTTEEVVHNKLIEVKNKLNKMKLKTKKGSEDFFLFLSFSFGLAEYFVDKDIMESIDKADHSMYVMKKMRKE